MPRTQPAPLRSSSVRCISSSELESPLFDACQSFLAEHDPDALLLPMICTGSTDSHYVRSAFGSTAFGFWPARSTPYEIWESAVHGHDERVHRDDLGYAALFRVHACRAILGATHAADR